MSEAEVGGIDLFKMARELLWMDSELENSTSPLRNESEHSTQFFLARCSDKRPSTQHLRPNIEPIYHLIQLVNDLKVRRNQPQ